MANQPVALILGAGPRIGADVARRFVADGYRVAVASRSGSGTKDVQGLLRLKADFARPETIPALFTAVHDAFKTAPSVVVYNAAARSVPPDESSTLSLPVETVAADLNVNTVSPYAAAQQAIKGFDTLPEDIPKSFIYTGNALNTQVYPMPATMGLGMGKCAAAYWIGVVDSTYSDKGYRFFYTDERYADGKIKGMAIDGPAHGDFYAQLATHKHTVPWHATFVKDQGYVKF